MAFVDKPDSVRNAFEDYIAHKHREQGKKGSTWDSEDKYRRHMKALEELSKVVKINNKEWDIDSLSLEDFNKETVFNTLFTHEPVLFGTKTKGGTIAFTASTKRNLGLALNAVIKQATGGGPSKFEIWNKKNISKSIPKSIRSKVPKGKKLPFETIGFALQQRGGKDVITLLPSSQKMNEAIFNTYKKTTSLKVKEGNKTFDIPENIIKTHMLLTTHAGLRFPELQYLTTDPKKLNIVRDAEQVEYDQMSEESSKGRFTSLDPKLRSIRIFNKGVATIYPLHPVLYVALDDAVKTARSLGWESVFPNTKAIQQNYIKRVMDELKQVIPQKDRWYHIMKGGKRTKETTPFLELKPDGTEVAVRMGHNTFRDNLFTSIYEDPKGTTHIADSVLGHKSSAGSTGLSHYLSFRGHEFQKGPVTTGQGLSLEAFMEVAREKRQREVPHASTLLDESFNINPDLLKDVVEDKERLGEADRIRLEQKQENLAKRVDLETYLGPEGIGLTNEQIDSFITKRNISSIEELQRYEKGWKEEVSSENIENILSRIEDDSEQQNVESTARTVQTIQKTIEVAENWEKPNWKTLENPFDDWQQIKKDAVKEGAGKLVSKNLSEIIPEVINDIKNKIDNVPIGSALYKAFTKVGGPLAFAEKVREIQEDSKDDPDNAGVKLLRILQMVGEGTLAAAGWPTPSSIGKLAGRLPLDIKERGDYPTEGSGIFHSLTPKAQEEHIKRRQGDQYELDIGTPAAPVDESVESTIGPEIPQTIPDDDKVSFQMDELLTPPPPSSIA